MADIEALFPLRMVIHKQKRRFEYCLKYPFLSTVSANEARGCLKILHAALTAPTSELSGHNANNLQPQN